MNNDHDSNSEKVSPILKNASAKNPDSQPSSAQKPARDYNGEVIKDDWWLRLTKVFHRFIGKE